MTQQFDDPERPTFESPVLDHWEGELPPSLLQITEQLKSHWLGGEVTAKFDGKPVIRKVHVIHPAEVVLAFASLDLRPVYGNFLLHGNKTDALTAMVLYWTKKNAPNGSWWKMSDGLMRQDYDWYFMRVIKKMFTIDDYYVTGYYKGWEGDALFATDRKDPWSDEQWESLKVGRYDGFTAHMFLSPVHISA